MSETTQLLGTLKKCLKARNISYKMLAEKLDLSEASVKRVFSEESFSLKRLEEVCKVMDLNFYDLVKLARKQTEEIKVMTLNQEKALSENDNLITYFYLLLNGWTSQEIISHYNYSQEESDKWLLKLDQLELIELHPGNKVKLLASRNLTWRKEGPIWKKYGGLLINEFLDNQFAEPNEILFFDGGEISKATMTIMKRKINKLFSDFKELVEIDEILPLEERESVVFMIACRPWVFSLLSKMKKTE